MIKVVRKGTVNFEAIEDGTLFFAVYSQDGSDTDYETVFLKIPLVDETNSDNSVTVGNNAVVIIGDETGNLCRFEPYESVIPIYNAKLVVEE
jgi:hypothetical protein